MGVYISVYIIIYIYIYLFTLDVQASVPPRQEVKSDLKQQLLQVTAQLTTLEERMEDGAGLSFKMALTWEYAAAFSIMVSLIVYGRGGGGLGLGGSVPSAVQRGLVSKQVWYRQR